jgi:hemin uptake protein HemP
MEAKNTADMNRIKQAHSQQTSGSDSPARVSSRALLGGRSELLIEHDGREYRLRLTQNGKLILTA